MLHHRLTVVVKLLTGGNLKLIQQILGGQFLLLLTAYIIDDLALVHHNQPVADGNGVLHIVGNHNGSQVISGHDLLRQIQHLLGGLRIQRCRVLIQQQHLGLLQSGHQQGHCLALTAAEQAHLGGQAGIQPQIQLL